MSDTPKKQCSVCHGNGDIEHVYEVFTNNPNTPDGIEQDSYFEPCVACAGTGEVDDPYGALPEDHREAIAALAYAALYQEAWNQVNWSRRLNVPRPPSATADKARLVLDAMGQDADRVTKNALAWAEEVIPARGSSV